MKQFQVKNIMVPLSRYAVISEESTIFEAFLALEKAQETFDRNHYPHRAILVKDHTGHIVGKLGQLDLLQALEPKYLDMGSDFPGMAKYGFSRQFLKSVIETYQMFDNPLDDLCKKAGMESAGKYMHRPTEGEYIDETDTLDQAIHMLIMGRHQSLLVTREKDIVGILRLSDVFSTVFNLMKSCDFRKT